MAKNIYGGGSQTNTNGLQFEQETDLMSAINSIPGYKIVSQNGHCIVYNNMDYIGIIVSKNKLYKQILEPKGVDYSKIISKKLLPDDAFYNALENKMYIIEKKFQNVAGSVDEKLQTCDFKKKQYQKLFAPLNIKVEYIYVFNDWFKKPQYHDVLQYILSVGCHFYFNQLPLNEIGLPLGNN